MGCERARRNRHVGLGNAVPTLLPCATEDGKTLLDTSFGNRLPQLPEHPVREIDCNHIVALFRQRDAEHAGAAAHIEDALARREREQLGKLCEISAAPVLVSIVRRHLVPAHPELIEGFVGVLVDTSIEVAPFLGGGHALQKRPPRR